MIARFRTLLLAVVGATALSVGLAAGVCSVNTDLALATLPTPTYTGTPTPTPAPPGSWAPGPDMPFSRAAHQAVRLDDGSILITGGIDPQFITWGPLRYVPWQHQFDNANHNGAFISRFTDTATIRANGSVLVTLYDHVDDQNSLSQVFYAPGGWTNPRLMQVPRYDHTATRLADDSILIIGGQNLGGPLLSTERHDLLSDTWTFDYPSPYERIRHTATMLDDGKILLSASLDSNLQTVPPQLWYNGVWLSAGAATGRRNATATKLLDGRVLVVGGVTNVGGSLVRADPEIYDPATNTWSPAGTLKREGHAAVLLDNGRVLVTGDAPYSNSAVTYDPVTNTWATVTPMLTGRAYHTASLLPDGRVLVVGGNTSLGITTGSELYTPAGFTGATFTPTLTPTPTLTNTFTPTPTEADTNTPTDTPTPSPTSTPCGGPCPTDTPTVPPTNTPTASPTSSIRDSDGDGCRDWQEQGQDPMFGGQRNPFFAPDFYDVNGTRKIDAVDIGLVRANYNPFGPVPPEDAIYDRSTGAHPWAPGAADGKINALDIALVRASFSHDCNLGF